MASLEFNKLAAAVLVAGIAVLATDIFSDEVFRSHKKEVTTASYPIEVPDAPTEPGAVAAPKGPEPVSALMASADVSKGQAYMRKCTACHTFDEGGKNGIGPNLWNIVNAPKAGVDGFSYSSALVDMADTKWTYESLNQFLYKPRDYAPGTKMNFAGIRKVEDRADVIAYLRSLSANPAPLPDVSATVEEPTSALTEEFFETINEETNNALGAVPKAAEQAADTVEETINDATESASQALEEGTAAAPGDNANQ